LAEHRGKLADWVGQTLADFEDIDAGRGRTATTPVNWTAEWKRTVDSGLPEFELASLVRLTLRAGKKTHKWVPRHLDSGWNLCPEAGCPSSSPLRYPVDTTRHCQVAQTDAKQIRVKGKTTLIAPAAGWIASVDTAHGLLNIAMDHAGLARTVFQGNIKVNHAARMGSYVQRGKPIASLNGDLDTATITFYRKGSPTLPIEWKSHVP
jgi:hypothetical protein